MFKPSEEFKKDVAEKNILHIRDELTTIAHEDRGFYTTKFDDALAYAEAANIEGLFDPFDGEIFKPKEEWDRNYWSLIVASLMDNFCKERIAHLKEVGKHVYPVQRKTDGFDSKQESSSQQHKEIRGKKTSPIIVLGVAAAAALIGYTIIGTKTAIGAAIIAGGIMMSRKRK